MNEVKPSEAKPKKMVRRVALALGILCVVLLIVSIGALTEDMRLQNQVNDLNRIVNFQETLFWMNNDTITVNPNQSISDDFYAPLGGNVKVVGYVQPPTAGIWTNLTWWVLYGNWFTYPYQDSPRPYVDNWFSNYFEEEYPIVSWPQFSEPATTVQFQIGNSGNATETVKLTITLTY